MEEAMKPHLYGRMDSDCVEAVSAGMTIGGGAIVMGANGDEATGGAPDCARCC